MLVPPPLMTLAQRCARLLVLVAWMALITFWSGQGNLPIDEGIVADNLYGWQHRVAHLCAYGLLGLLAHWAFDGSARATFWAIVLTSTFGAIDEWHQSFTPGRRAALDDWALDTASAALAIYVITRLRATRVRPVVRALAPLAVSAAFVVGIGLAARPLLPVPLHTTSLRSVATSAVQLVRDTRHAARQLRTSASG
jgi:hypothetical protein